MGETAEEGTHLNLAHLLSQGVGTAQAQLSGNVGEQRFDAVDAAFFEHTGLVFLGMGKISVTHDIIGFYFAPFGCEGVAEVYLCVKSRRKL